jgi:hypothetical protein
MEEGNATCRAERALTGVESSTSCNNCTYAWDVTGGDIDGNSSCAQWLEWYDKMTIGYRPSNNGGGRLMYYYNGYGWDRWANGQADYGDTTTTWTFEDQYDDYGYDISMGMTLEGEASDWPKQ